MFSTYKPKDSGEKCNCCDKWLNDQEFFQSNTCGHCLVAIKNLKQDAPPGFYPVRIRQLQLGDIFLNPFLSQRELRVTSIDRNRFVVDAYRYAIMKNSVSHELWEKSKYFIGINSQQWVWKKENANGHDITIDVQE